MVLSIIIIVEHNRLNYNEEVINISNSLIATICFFGTLKSFAALARGILSFLMVLDEFVVGLKGVEVNNLEIEVGNGFVVLFRNISFEVRERMNWPVGWNHDVWSSHQELYEILLMYPVYCGIFCLKIYAHLIASFPI